ncbi:hypothetical protein HS088_TW12G01110 [Tripterygium wilfordii]|uniref:Uncharacterized protein n=1 Tax=Tripterygium wilfordii TaxID=458696 RepID=A0A7J7D0Z1_TRIWF|nr:uncharacterized protein LOC120010358 [Tripterygium wilfordii]KAF5739899.1 hypothetical protein HS088_TW12G01110 [Tripterygium wilfordii]
MELQTPTNQTSTQDLENPKNGRTHETHSVPEQDIDSTCSTPYVSAPSSPGHVHGPGSGPLSGGGFFYSAPASPMHFAITSSASISRALEGDDHGSNSVPFGYEFEFSARYGSNGSDQTGSMSSADELFLNGKIRPMKLSTHLERPQVLAPLIDLEDDDDSCNNDGESSRGRDLRQIRDKSMRRRTRSMSPLRTTSFQFDGNGDTCFNNDELTEQSTTNDDKYDDVLSSPSMSTPSASSSRSSSAGRNSKRWVFLKDFLYRSKSEGRASSNNKKFWSTITFSPVKEKKPINNPCEKEAPLKVKNGIGITDNQQKVKKPVNGIGKRRRVPPSAHELHYMASRAQAEEMKKRTYLPYKQGLLGCLGFSSKGYGAMNGLARAFNSASSR